MRQNRASSTLLLVLHFILSPFFVSSFTSHPYENLACRSWRKQEEPLQLRKENLDALNLFSKTKRRRRGWRGNHFVKSLAATNTDSVAERDILLYNSLSRSKDVFQSVVPGKVSMYTCGPTVYDHAHVGNFRAFLTYDVLKRVLQYFGYDVTHVCNLTDVDDKIIKRCNEEGISLVDLTNKYADLFMADLQALNIVPASIYPRATQHIPEMAEMILDLQKNNLAYQSEEGSWYFSVSAQEGYGKQLVTLNVKGMRDGGGDGPSKKQSSSSTTAATAEDNDEYDAEDNARDFALWKAFKPGVDREDASWDVPGIGLGRPGWHLECSAMARKYFGDDTIDLHCGGIDLKFPHHENEIAQSEGATGKKFCNCWLHNGFVNIGEEKMSKSKGNFVTLRGACPKAIDVRAYRYLVVSSHYRNPLSFTDGAMNAAKGALKRIDRLRGQLGEVLADENKAEEDEEVGSDSENSMVTGVQSHLKNFNMAIADDLSMPRAAASMFGVLKLGESEFKRFAKEEKKQAGSTSLDVKGLLAVHSALLEMDKIFGLFYEVPQPSQSDNGMDKTSDRDDEGVIPVEVMDLVVARVAAKDAKDWDLADSLRKRISELGFAVKDVKGGDPVVSRVD